MARPSRLGRGVDEPHLTEGFPGGRPPEGSQTFGTAGRQRAPHHVCRSGLPKTEDRTGALQPSSQKLHSVVS